MDWAGGLWAIARRIPAIPAPSRHLGTVDKLAWTAVGLVGYLVLSNIPMFGLSPNSVDLFYQFRAYFAGEQGSLATIGISTLLTAYFILYLLWAIGVLKHGERLHTWARFGAFLLVPIVALVEIRAGFLQPSEILALQWGVSNTLVQLLIFAQICLGAVVLIYFAELITKWGIASGPGLIIVSGISLQIFNGFFNWWNTLQPFQFGSSVLQPPVGLVPRWIWMATDPNAGLAARSDSHFFFGRYGGEILGLMGFVVVFAVVLYFDRLWIPLQGSIDGRMVVVPQKFLFVFGTGVGGSTGSVLYLLIPLAILFPNLGSFDTAINPSNPTPIAGPAFYLGQVNGPEDWLPSMAKPTLDAYRLANGLSPISEWEIWLRLFVYASILISLMVLFAVFWAGVLLAPSRAHLKRCGLMTHDLPERLWAMFRWIVFLPLALIPMGSFSGLFFGGHLRILLAIIMIVVIGLLAIYALWPLLVLSPAANPLMRRGRADAVPEALPFYFRLAALNGLLLGLLFLFSSMFGSVGQISAAGFLIAIVFYTSLIDAPRLFCPNCSKRNLHLFLGGDLGRVYSCTCGYTGLLALDRPPPPPPEPAGPPTKAWRAVEDFFSSDLTKM